VNFGKAIRSPFEGFDDLPEHGLARAVRTVQHQHRLARRLTDCHIMQPQLRQDLAGMEAEVLYRPIARLLLWWVGRECGGGEQQRGGGRDQRAEGRAQHGSDPFCLIIVGYVGSSVKHVLIPIFSRLAFADLDRFEHRWANEK
jgi:hypothetical protein